MKNGLPVIQLENLYKGFAGESVLKGINLEVREGETVAILGRSGSGKSVLLKLIIGLLNPDSGSIRIMGQEIGHLSIWELNEIRKKIGFLFQDGALYDSLSVQENVAFPLQRHTDISDAEMKHRVDELLRQVGMQDSGNKMPSEISGGMKKRVGLARALALDPCIMLLDEPTAGLDPITAGEIDDLICRLQQERNASSVVVTHDMHTVKMISDRIAVLNEAQMAVQGIFEDLRNSNDPIVAEFIENSS